MKKTQPQTQPKKITIEDEVALAVTVADKKLIPKKKTQKKKSKTIDNDFVMDVVERFKKNGISVVESLSEKELQDVLDYTNTAYRNMEPIMTDSEYDIIHDYMETKYPNNPILHLILLLPNYFQNRFFQNNQNILFLLDLT